MENVWRTAVCWAVLGAEACLGQPPPNQVKPETGDLIRASVYADNWFAMYINGKLVAVDPIDFLPHNQVNVDVLPEYPMTIAIMAKDNADPRTGLEYGNHIGDAGFILKFTDGTVTNADWKARVFSKGPLNRDVANPTVQNDPVPPDWYAPGFDDSTWDNATEYEENRVKPDGNYVGTDFDGARFIWTSDLELDNTVIFRYRVDKPGWQPRWNTHPELDNSCAITAPAKCPCAVPPAGAGGGTTTAPGAPQLVAAAAGNGSASVEFTAPASNGGAAITAYTATCSDGGKSVTATGPASPIQVSGLTNGTTYSCSVTATNMIGTGPASPAASVTPAAPVAQPGRFTVTSAASADGGTMAADYTCDGMGSTIPLAWSGAPAGTKEFAVMMTTQPGDGTTKWNWVLYRIPGSVTSLTKDSFLVGVTGVGSDGPGMVYNPPCSQGPGAKVYKFTLYALSEAPTLTVPPEKVTGQVLTNAIAPITLGSASLSLIATRTATTGSSTECSYILSSTRASRSGTPVVACDGNYAYVGSLGIPAAPMMNGITSTNLQVPLPQNFQGANGWKIPLKPALAAKPTSVVDGPIGVAINGVPIFNPCTQGGCTSGGDTKALGQLDSCNGHAGRADDYHYHAAPKCLMADQPANYWDTHPLGWALDGFAIFGYRDADGTTAARDEVCGGNAKPVQNAPAGYSYHVTEVSPYVAACLAGTPSPDLANQGKKYKPMRQPPVTPFNVSDMTLATDPADGYQVLQFSSAISFRSTETGSDSYRNPPGTYRIRYRQVTGNELTALLALRQNANATACWNFQFVDSSGTATQPAVSYCK
jgi:phosphatidylethanolamine-binding protein (PEBP) family uncharacterized protein